MASSTSKMCHGAGRFLFIALVAALAGCGQKSISPGSRSAGESDDSFRDFALRAVIRVPDRPITAFDISWVSAATRTYYIADRSNAGVDIIDSRTNAFLGRVPGFVGADPRGNNFSGPNGVLTIDSQHELWAADGPGPRMNSSVKVVDLASHPPSVIDTIHTNGTLRSDEMSYDPVDHILAVVNNADDPPFVSLISTLAPRRVLHRIDFNADLGRPFGVTAFTDGLEQSVFNPHNNLFYLSVPELDGMADRGAIAVIDPRTAQVTRLFRVNDCHPAGLALGPHQDLLIGCSDPSRVVVMDARDGSIDREILQVGGTDEVWFNPGDEHYYLAARDNASGPVLGVVDAENNRFTTSVGTTFNAHSVAADPINNHVFVPLRPPRAGQADPDPCVDFGGPTFAGRGCIGVYFRGGDEEEG